MTSGQPAEMQVDTPVEGGPVTPSSTQSALSLPFAQRRNIKERICTAGSPRSSVDGADERESESDFPRGINGDYEPTERSVGGHRTRMPVQGVLKRLRCVNRDDHDDGRLYHAARNTKRRKVPLGNARVESVVSDGSRAAPVDRRETNLPRQGLDRPPLCEPLTDASRGLFTTDHANIPWVKFPWGGSSVKSSGEATLPA